MSAASTRAVAHAGVRDTSTRSEGDTSARFAFVDPPYYGYAAKFYAHLHPEAAVYDTLAAHRALIDHVVAAYPDGWAFCMTSGNLHDLLPLFPASARIAAWVKPFASFKKGVSPAYTWEPVVFQPAGRRHDQTTPTVRDHLSQGITLRRGLVGAKPEQFCRWVLHLLGWRAGDVVDDLFPGTGVMGRVVARAAEELDFGVSA